MAEDIKAAPAAPTPAALPAAKPVTKPATKPAAKKKAAKKVTAAKPATKLPAFASNSPNCTKKLFKTDVCHCFACSKARLS